MSGYHYCERCAQPVHPGKGVVAWRLDGSEVVVHADISVCEWEIRTDPDVVPEPALTVVAGVREPGPRMTGHFERDSGSPTFLAGA